MARKDRDRQAPKEQLDAYRKEIGKQYMDGLISDKEYEALLKQKEAELGLNKASAPAPAKGTGAECPSCGALVGEQDTECGICGSVLSPVLVVAEDALETEDIPVNSAPENWREEWLDKQYRDLALHELLGQSPDVLKGVSAGDSARLREAFNIRTLEDFATTKYFAWAQELVALKGTPGAYRKRDFKFRLVREYEQKALDDILKAPTHALQGVSEGDAKKLAAAFNTRTVEELGNLKFILWANRIHEMAQAPRIFKVGDRVRLPSGQKGTVIAATEPDARGMQKVDVEVR